MHLRRKIAHRNVCEENITVVGERTAKLINLEYSQFEDTPTKLPVDHVKYFPREIEPDIDAFNLDLFQFGCIIANFTAGKKVITKYSKTKDISGLLANLEGDLKDFISILLLNEPENQRETSVLYVYT